jgi:hypothetical protein
MKNLEWTEHDGSAIVFKKEKDNFNVAISKLASDGCA